MRSFNKDMYWLFSKYSIQKFWDLDQGGFILGSFVLGGRDNAPSVTYMMVKGDYAGAIRGPYTEGLLGCM